MRFAVLIGMVVALAAGLPGSAHRAKAAKDGGAVRIATLAPRNSELVKGLIKLDKGIQASTDGRWKLKLYPSGVAGDEKDTLRKIRVGQLDATVVTSVGLSLVLKELAILTTPGVIETYKQLERVQKAMNSEWEGKLSKAGYKHLAWGEIGMLRFFSKKELKTPYDLKDMRPWLWPSSHTMKSTLKAIGATGVPLGVPEVYGALQTGMIDAVISSALGATALQWHAKLSHVTLDTYGPLVGGMVIAEKRWGELPEDLREVMKERIEADYNSSNKDVRKQDVIALKKLLKRGYKGTKLDAAGQKDRDTVMRKSREALVGRVFSKKLLDRVLKLRGG